MTTTETEGRPHDAWLFFALACAITWTLAAPLSLAWLDHRTPSPLAMLLAGLSAFGPTLAATLVASRTGTIRRHFTPWRTAPGWIALGLALPLLLHLPATALEVALGGSPKQWFYPPVTPEHVAALVFFSVGEEFGWRGFAYPRLAARHGPVVGSLMLGAVWGLWHLVMMVTPDGRLQVVPGLFVAMAELAVWSVVIAWLFERSGRSLAVAIAVHMGAHLDNVNRAPEGETRLRILRFAVVVVAALLAAKALRKGPGAVSTPG